MSDAPIDPLGDIRVVEIANFAAAPSAAAIMADLGAVIVDAKLPDLDACVAAWKTLCSAEAAHAHRATFPARAGDYGPWFRGWLEFGAAVTGAQYAEANSLRLESNGLLRRLFGEQQRPLGLLGSFEAAEEVGLPCDVEVVGVSR